MLDNMKVWCVLLEAIATGGERMVKQINTKGGNVLENEMLFCGAQFLIFKRGLFVL